PENGQGGNGEVGAGQGDQPHRDLPVQLLRVQRRGQRKSAEEQEDDRIGKGFERLLRGQLGHADGQRDHGNQQGGNGDVNRLGEPEDGDEQQQRQSLVGAVLIRQDRIQPIRQQRGDDQYGNTLGGSLGKTPVRLCQGTTDFSHCASRACFSGGHDKSG